MNNVLNKINAAGQNGKIFTVTFIKRLTGEKRIMNARLYVKKHLKGGEKKYNDIDHKLVTVYDMKCKGYRCIPLDTVISINGQLVSQEATQEL